MNDTPRTDAADFARALERENARLKADKARLDWLMEKANWHTPLTMYGPEREYRFRTPTTTPTIDVRAAIDAAMQSTPQPAG